MFFIFVYSLAISNVAASLKCADISTSGMPCVDVPLCSSGKTGSVVVNKLSNGLGSSKSASQVDLCYDTAYLKIKYSSFKQQYFSNVVYDECNDSVFNSDVAEVFIAPQLQSETAPHCYSEIDVNPANAIFESGIYNPNLNHTGIIGYSIDCGSSGIVHSTVVDKSSNTWTESLSIPWNVVDHPNCPSAREAVVSTSTTAATAPAYPVYRANFFRVNELVSVPTCSSTTCEYMAWSPTGSNPPAFHEPTRFGYLVLQQQV